MGRNERYKTHDTRREAYEEQGHKIIEQALKKYYPNKTFNIKYTTDNWCRTDLLINGKRVEYKCRWWKTQEQVDRYTKEGFVLNKKKLPYNDVFFYYIQLTKQLYMISTKNIIKGIEEGKITSKQVTTTKYQFDDTLGEIETIDNYLIPIECFEKVFQL